VKDPIGFPNGQMWNDTPPAGETKPGEIRVRDVSPEQDARECEEAAARRISEIANLPA
jgi:hypothetical protein